MFGPGVQPVAARTLSISARSSACETQPETVSPSSAYSALHVAGIGLAVSTYEPPKVEECAIGPVVSWYCVATE